MIIEILILLISFIIFAYVGDYLVLALEFISHRLKIPETVVGATFAAIGSSAPNRPPPGMKKAEGLPLPPFLLMGISQVEHTTLIL